MFRAKQKIKLAFLIQFHQNIERKNLNLFLFWTGQSLCSDTLSWIASADGVVRFPLAHLILGTATSGVTQTLQHTPSFPFVSLFQFLLLPHPFSFSLSLPPAAPSLALGSSLRFPLRPSWIRPPSRLPRVPSCRCACGRTCWRSTSGPGRSSHRRRSWALPLRFRQTAGWRRLSWPEGKRGKRGGGLWTVRMMRINELYCELWFLSNYLFVCLSMNWHTCFFEI